MGARLTEHLTPWSLIFLEFFFWRTSVLFRGHWYPCFGLLVTSTLGFKAREDSLTYMLLWLHAMDSSDSPPVWHLLTFWWPAWQPSHFIHVLAYKHWWTWVQDGECHCLTACGKADSTDWAELAQLRSMILIYTDPFHLAILTTLSRFNTGTLHGGCKGY